MFRRTWNRDREWTRIDANGILKNWSLRFGKRMNTWPLMQGGPSISVGELKEEIESW